MTDKKTAKTPVLHDGQTATATKTNKRSKPPTDSELAAFARQTLWALLKEDRLSPGDLLKVMALDSKATTTAQPQDYLVVIREDA